MFMAIRTSWYQLVFLFTFLNIILLTNGASAKRYSDTIDLNPGNYENFELSLDKDASITYEIQSTNGIPIDIILMPDA